MSALQRPLSEGESEQQFSALFLLGEEFSHHRLDVASGA
jgi:hypothetical protein